MGQDLMGYHPDSLFRSDGIGGTSGGKDLYDSNDAWDALQWNGNLKSRRGPYLPLENANAYRLEELYKQTDPYRSDRFVLGDVYNRVSNLKTGRRVGMPILYYKADTSKNAHDRLDPDNPNNIYDYLDNYDLVLLGFPGQAMPPAGPSHELEDARRFYANTRNDKVSIDRPYKADTYILISAGFDGEYGTADDICNFDWKYMELP